MPNSYIASPVSLTKEQRDQEGFAALKKLIRPHHRLSDYTEPNLIELYKDLPKIFPKLIFKNISSMIDDLRKLDFLHPLTLEIYVALKTCNKPEKMLQKLLLISEAKIQITPAKLKVLGETAGNWNFDYRVVEEMQLIENANNLTTEMVESLKVYKGIQPSRFITSYCNLIDALLLLKKEKYVITPEIGELFFQELFHGYDGYGNYGGYVNYVNLAEAVLLLKKADHLSHESIKVFLKATFFVIHGMCIYSELVNLVIALDKAKRLNLNIIETILCPKKLEFKTPRCEVIFKLDADGILTGRNVDAYIAACEDPTGNQRQFIHLYLEKDFFKIDGFTRQENFNVLLLLSKVIVKYYKDNRWRNELTAHCMMNADYMTEITTLKESTVRTTFSGTVSLLDFCTETDEHILLLLSKNAGVKKLLEDIKLKATNSFLGGIIEAQRQKALARNKALDSALDSMGKLFKSLLSEHACWEILRYLDQFDLENFGKAMFIEPPVDMRYSRLKP